MKISQITAILGAPLAAAAGFFEMPDSSGLRAKLEKTKLNIFDAKNSVLPDTFDSWSVDELKSWANYHKLKSEGDAKHLVKVARENKDLLAEDIKQYVSVTTDKNWIELGKQYMANVKDSLVENTNDAKSAAKEAAEANAKDAKAVGKDAVDAGKKHANKVADAGKEQADKIANAGKEQADEAMNKGKHHLKNAVKAGKEHLKQAVEGGKEHVDAAVDAGKQKLNKAMHAGKDKAQDAANAGKEYAQDAANSGKEYAKGAAANIKGAAADAMEAGKEHAAKAADAGEDKAASAMKAGKEAAADAKEAGQEYAEDAMDAGKKHAKVAHKAAKKHAGDIKDKAAKKGNEHVANAKDFVNKHAKNAHNFAQQWSDESVRDFLEIRGIEVPAKATRAEMDKLLEQAKSRGAELKAKAGAPLKRFWFDSWSMDDLKDTLKKTGNSLEGTRDDMVNRISSLYNKASTDFSKGVKEGAEQTKEALSSIGSWKEANFNTWSLSDLQDYLRKFGDQASGTKDELAAKAYSNYRYFVYGDVKPKGFKGHVSHYYNQFSDYVSNFIAPRVKFDL